MHVAQKLDVRDRGADAVLNKVAREAARGATAAPDDAYRKSSAAPPAKELHRVRDARGEGVVQRAKVDRLRASKTRKQENKQERKSGR